MSNKKPHNATLTYQDVAMVREVYETSAIELIETQKVCTRLEEKLIRLQLEYNKAYQKLQRARQNTSIYHLAEKYDVTYAAMRKLLKYETYPDVV